ncbi:M57 family metalloprotease [uncultured Aquimarina sp.]|uniref:M57 family metalloprotease n=1 Tax=uncultured Aquimarina sp. TaxID=575652 RepID=UPI00260AC89F|nr:M57 family metalloprotease [uncultured Aquimarina sp.]
MKKLFKKLFLLNLLLLIFIGCSKDDLLTENESIPEIDSVFETLKAWGFSDHEIEDMGTYYLVDKDIVFYKNKKYHKPENSNTKQREHPNSVTINSIQVFINPGMNQAWRNASVDAINRWNNASSGLLLNITTTTANAHIEIMYDSQDPALTLAANVFGMGEFPATNGLPGTRIWINPDFNACSGAITQNMRISNVQHELGHNLGLTHTNQTFGSLIPGTPSTDAQSVMNGGQACTINNFSTGDFSAVAFLFPPLTPTGSSLVCNTSTAVYTIENSNIPLTWTTSSNLQILSSSNNSITVKPVNSSFNGSGFVQANSPTQNIRKDVWIGKAVVDYIEFGNGIGETDYFCSSHYGNTYDIFPRLSGTTHQIRLRRWPSLSIVYSPSTNYSGNSGTLNYTPSPGWYVFGIRRTNPCGTSEWFETEVEFVDCSNNEGGGEF